MQITLPPIVGFASGGTFPIIAPHKGATTEEILMPDRRYQLIEKLPYPRATRRGGLTDPADVPLHGVYERKIAGGYRAALVNNGAVVHRYDYLSSLVGKPTESTRSFANLVHTLDPWVAPDDAERPVTNDPPSENPWAKGWRPLWHEPLNLQSLPSGTKRVGLLAGELTETDTWAAIAAEHGLFVRQARAWTTYNGDPWRLTLMARPGPLADVQDLEALRVEYAAQLPWLPTGGALARLSQMTAGRLQWDGLVNPESDDDLIISGFCFGYPVATTAGCITGTHG